jgi:hypothetical protein
MSVKCIISTIILTDMHIFEEYRTNEFLPEYFVDSKLMLSSIYTAKTPTELGHKLIESFTNSFSYYGVTHTEPNKGGGFKAPATSIYSIYL